MADFDKVQTPSADATGKKMGILVVLICVLAGLMIHYSMKNGPREASAAVAKGAAGTLIPRAETPAEARAALAIDPTMELLRGALPTDVSFDEVPHNPFAMAPSWRAELVRPAPAVHHVIHQASSAPVAAPEPLVLSGYKLSSIIQQDQHLYAIINGNIVTDGMTVDNLKVVDITDTTVTLQRADSPDGPTATLTIERKLK